MPRLQTGSRFSRAAVESDVLSITYHLKAGRVKVLGIGSFWGNMTVACLMGMICAGCGIPERGYGSRQFMQPVEMEMPAMQPPAGKSMVVFHRPATFAAGVSEESSKDLRPFTHFTLQPAV